MMKVFRPFWSYQVTKTEKWLSEMARDGYHFVKLNRSTRCFYFQHGNPEEVIYQIEYNQEKNVQLPERLLNSGWMTVFQTGCWSVIKNENPYDKIAFYCGREGIAKYNRKILRAFGIMFIYLSFVYFINLSFLTLSLFDSEPIKVEESPMWFVTYTIIGISISLYLLSIYSITSIYRANKYLLAIKDTKHVISKENEKLIKKAGKVVVKRKFGWFYEADRLEKWLELMEEKGFNLYRVNRFGTTFYFQKGTPRKMKYCADYQNRSNENYFELHREAGWKSVFISRTFLQKWTIWSREYSLSEECPQFYSDSSHLVKHAKRVAITYTSLFFPLIFMYMWLLIFASIPIGLFNVLVYLLVIIAFCTFIIKTWLYYFRKRKQII